MAITSVDSLLAGFQPPSFGRKIVTGGFQGNPYNQLYTDGIPGKATAPSVGLSGTAVTSFPGTIPFSNAPGGSSAYLARAVISVGAFRNSTFVVADRLWHNSGIDRSLTTAQTINSVTFPARDINGSTNGEGVFIAAEVTIGVTGGSPTVTINYTNSAGVTNRTGTLLAINTQLGAFNPFTLDAGDTGVRSIQSYTQTAAWPGIGSAISLVAYRPIAVLPTSSPTDHVAWDPIELGLPLLYPDSVPFYFNVGVGASSHQVSFTMAHG